MDQSNGAGKHTDSHTPRGKGKLSSVLPRALVDLGGAFLVALFVQSVFTVASMVVE